jgi:PTH1 family peptidyl-tRNA hydrolase
MPAVIGLGNPGACYAATRHNMGFRAVDTLAAALGAGPWRADGPSFLARARLGGREVLLAKPSTFMNRSGLAASDLVLRHGVLLAELLVICDDFNLPFASLRFRAQGGDGGHHGLASIIGAIGTEAIARLRLGVGPDPGGDRSVFVLAPFPEGQEEAAGALARRGAEAALCWLREGAAAAMNLCNRPEPGEACAGTGGG